MYASNAQNEGWGYEGDCQSLRIVSAPPVILRLRDSGTSLDIG